jgi:hypothetical protein
MNEESKTELHKLLMQWYEKGANDAEAALKEAMEYGIDIAIKAEREACALLCESEGARIDASWGSCAAAIRGRTE